MSHSMSGRVCFASLLPRKRRGRVVSFWNRLHKRGHHQESVLYTWEMFSKSTLNTYDVMFCDKFLILWHVLMESVGSWKFPSDRWQNKSGCVKTLTNKVSVIWMTNKTVKTTITCIVDKVLVFIHLNNEV